VAEYLSSHSRGLRMRASSELVYGAGVVANKTSEIAQQLRDIAAHIRLDGATVGQPLGCSPNASARPWTRTSHWMPMLQRAANGARGRALQSASCGPLASTGGASVGFSTPLDDPSNREFSSIDNERWKMSPPTAPPFFDRFRATPKPACQRRRSRHIHQQSDRV
jgi:hypothetical protein